MARLVDPNVQYAMFELVLVWACWRVASSSPQWLNVQSPNSMVALGAALIGSAAFLGAVRYLALAVKSGARGDFHGQIRKAHEFMAAVGSTIALVVIASGIAALRLGLPLQGMLLLGVIPAVLALQQVVARKNMAASTAIAAPALLLVGAAGMQDFMRGSACALYLIAFPAAFIVGGLVRDQWKSGGLLAPDDVLHIFLTVGVYSLSIALALM